LKGDAASSLKHLSVSDANDEPVWEELKRKYDKKNIIIQSHIENIMEQKTLTLFSAVHIKRLTNTTSESVHASACLEAMNTWDNILVPICVKLTDIEDIDVLTPDHFLPVDRLMAIKEPTTEDFLI
jgi:hypothetical protein